MRRPPLPVVGDSGGTEKYEVHIKRRAGRFARSPDEFNELCQEGRIAAFQALQKLDTTIHPDAQGRFMDLSISGAMLHYLERKSRMIHVPAYLQERLRYDAEKLPPDTASLDVLTERDELRGEQGQDLLEDHHQNTEAQGLEEIEFGEILKMVAKSKTSRESYEALISGTSTSSVAYQCHMRKRLREARREIRRRQERA